MIWELHPLICLVLTSGDGANGCIMALVPLGFRKITLPFTLVSGPRSDHIDICKSNQLFGFQKYKHHQKPHSRINRILNKFK